MDVSASDDVHDDAQRSSSMLVSWSGLIGSTVTVLLTTIDDSVWLLPFIGTQDLSRKARVVNAVTFLVSLVGLAILCCLLGFTIQTTVATKSIKKEDGETKDDELEFQLQLIAVIICWVLAIGFYVKKQLKRRKSRQHQVGQQADTQTTSTQGIYGSLLSQDGGKQTEEDHLITATNKDDDEEEKDDEEETPPNSTGSQPCTIISLTMIGFLDEVSYFPALIIGDIFTVWELCIGTFLAGIIMLTIQIFIATQCTPIIQCLDDHVKLYHVIAVFATLLTIQLIFEVKTG